MLRTDGALFHIDFGYILGRDPKPFPPPMKLCKEMVEAMGGADSRLYERFRVLCCEAFDVATAAPGMSRTCRGRFADMSLRRSTSCARRRPSSSTCCC